MDSKKVWMWVGIAAAVVVVAAVAWFALAANADVTVPSVVGQNQDQAVRTLQAVGLKLGATMPATGTADSPGTCVTQSPGAGTKVKKGAAIDLSIAEATALVMVPDVKGQEEAAATNALKAKGLTPTPYSDYNTSTPAGQVFGQVPLGGQKVDPGTSVAIGISLGTRPTSPAVPNVVDKTKADATAELGKAGFGVDVYESYSGVTSGRVISQFPAAGAKALAGSEVAIQVSTGPAPTSTPSSVKIPNVVGQTQAEASSALANAGLSVAPFTEYNATVAKGSVIGQLPKAGSSVAKGTEVGIAISGGKEPASVVVPNVVGMSSAEATKAVEELGLRVLSVPLYSSKDAPGTVLAQLPTAGSTVPPGSQVAVEVAVDVKPTQLPY
jgi:serine/threonine-protein kinase